ncbi:hypothetical protein PG984_013020 [Apiospora sp. TS-2023a]
MDSSSSQEHDRPDSNDSHPEHPQKKQQEATSTVMAEDNQCQKPLHICSQSCEWKLDLTSGVPGVTRIGYNTYQFQVLLNELPELNRVALGIPNAASFISVRTSVDFHDSTLHFGSQSQFPHGTLDGSPNDHSLESSNSPVVNFLTHLVVTKLHREVTENQMYLRNASAMDIRNRIIRVAREANRVATTCCIQCEKPLPFGTTVARPVACSSACQTSYDCWPLEVRLSPLLLDPSVIDILFNCVVAQATALLHETQLNPSGKSTPPLDGFDDNDKVAELIRILDTFPAMTPGITLQDIVNFGDEGEERRKVLDWLCRTFQGMIVPTPISDRVEFRMPITGEKFVPQSFLLLNANLQRQTAFNKSHEDQQIMEELVRLPGDTQESKTSAVFHGTPAQNVFSILCDGMKKSVNEIGDVWYACDPFCSTYYLWKGVPEKGSQQLGRSWKNSMFKNQQLLFGLEIVGQTGLEAWYAARCEQKKIMVRHLFVIPTKWEDSLRNVPCGDTDWARDYIRPQMERTFARIQDGSLIRDVHGEATTSQGANPNQNGQP